MTRAFLPLLRNNIKVTFGLSRDVKQRKRELIIWGALCALFIPLLILVCVGVYFLSKNMTIDLIASTIASIMFASEVMVLFFGVKSVVSLLFFSQDNEFLMSLPATGLDIFLSKFVTIYLLHLGMALLIQLPIFITLGIGAAISNIGFYIFAIVGGMLTPFVPLFVLIIFAIPLGYLISYFRKNNLIGTILVLLLFGGVFAGYYYLIFAMQNSLQSGSLNMVELQNAMKIMSYIIYPNTYLANSMITTGMEAFKNFGIFFAIIMGLAALSVGLAGFLYKNSARRGLEVGNKNNGKAKDNSVQSLKSALLKRDLKTCLGETSSAINYLIGFVLAPIIVIMLSFIYSNNPEMDSRYVMEIVSVFIVFMFGGGMNYFAIVGISREGRQMDVLKMLPVSSKTIINQKLMLSAIYTLVMAAILMASMFIAKLNFVLIIMLTLSILFAGNATNIFALHYDVKAPNFVWNNYKELFKNNYKSLNSMLLCLPIMIIGVISIICVDIVCAGQIPNTNLSCFVKMLPVLIASIVYLVVAVIYNYPKILETYEKIEI